LHTSLFHLSMSLGYNLIMVYRMIPAATTLLKDVHTDIPSSGG